MSRLRRHDTASRERTAAERERARLEREARRTGRPVPPPQEPPLAEAPAPPRVGDPVAPPPLAPPAPAAMPPAAPEPAPVPPPAAPPPPTPEPPRRVTARAEDEQLYERQPVAAPAGQVPRDERRHAPIAPPEVAPRAVRRIQPDPPPPPAAPAGALPDDPDRPIGTRIGRRGAPPRAVVTPPGDVPTGPRNAKRRTAHRLVGIAAVLLIVGVAWLVNAVAQPFAGDGEGTVRVTIPAGAGVGTIGDLLAANGVVDSGFFFEVRATLSGSRGDLRSGPHTLRRDMSYGAAIDALSAVPAATAAPATIDVTVPEGRARREIVDIVEQAGLGGDYMRASRRSDVLSPRRDYQAPRGTRTLEGFLFPATYELKADATAGDLVEKQLAAFEEKVATVSLREAERKNLTPYDVLIIASMVEREAQVADERPIIAAVIHNRLKDGMRLGIDATIRYATDNWTRPLRQSELQIDSPYNTRTNTGLPPTPIGNPGLDSIRAAANPADVDFLYYVVKPGTCGEHAFSATDAGFQRDVSRYNSERAARGGKSPTNC